jgi:hypothetical protein
VNNTVQDRVAERGLADNFMPGGCREFDYCHPGGAGAVGSSSADSRAKQIALVLVPRDVSVGVMHDLNHGASEQSLRHGPFTDAWSGRFMAEQSVRLILFGL